MLKVLLRRDDGRSARDGFCPGWCAMAVSSRVIVCTSNGHDTQRPLRDVSQGSDLESNVTKRRFLEIFKSFFP